MQVLDDGVIRFVQADGESFDSARPIGDWQELTADHERSGIQIDRKDCRYSVGRGPLDYGMAIDALMYVRRAVSGETSPPHRVLE